MPVAEVLIPAVVNGILTAVVFLASRRRFLADVAAVLALFIALLSVLWFWPGSEGLRRHPQSLELAAYATIVAITWLLGALLALLAGRIRQSKQIWASATAIVSGTLMGAGYIITGLAVVCGVLGDCL
jgi:hypothetical protein